MSSQRDVPLLHVHGSTVPNTRRPTDRRPATSAASASRPCSYRNMACRRTATGTDDPPSSHRPPRCRLVTGDATHSSTYTPPWSYA